LSGRARDKISSLSETAAKVALAQERGDRIVFSNGCFDLLHVGHVRNLEAARALGDRLVVAVNLDASVRRLKGEDRPIQPARTRMEVVAALACVDWVLGFAGDTPIRPIRTLRPDILAKGGDWAEGEIIGGDDVLAWGGRVVRLPTFPGERTSDTIQRIRRRPKKKKR